MKTVIVGGSAHSMPALFDSALPFDGERFSFALVGRSRRRLAAVKRAIDVIGTKRATAIDCAIWETDSIEAALAGADVVLVQFRIGGYAARQWDETFPHRYGVCGDEGLGPGGLAAAWRTWHELEKLLAEVARIRPAATVILLTSPIGILTRCAREAFPQLAIYGICELPWTTLRGLCREARLDASAARYAYLAVNHLGWFAHLHAASYETEASAATFPLKYVRLDDAPRDVLREQRAAPPRGSQLEALAAHAFPTYESASAQEIVDTVRRRPTPWYEHAIGPLLQGFAGIETATTFFLTTRNAGYEPQLDDGDFLEIPHELQAGKLRRRESRPWTNPAIANRIGRLVAYERTAALAVRSRDIAQLARALRLHPWLDDVPIGAELVADVVREIRSPVLSSR